MSKSAARQSELVNVTTPQEDPGDLAQAGWAVRRLTGARDRRPALPTFSVAMTRSIWALRQNGSPISRAVGLS